MRPGPTAARPDRRSPGLSSCPVRRFSHPGCRSRARLRTKGAGPRRLGGEAPKPDSGRVPAPGGCARRDLAHLGRRTFMEAARSGRPGLPCPEDLFPRSSPLKRRSCAMFARRFTTRARGRKPGTTGRPRPTRRSPGPLDVASKSRPDTAEGAPTTGGRAPTTGGRGDTAERHVTAGGRDRRRPTEAPRPAGVWTEPCAVAPSCSRGRGRFAGPYRPTPPLRSPCRGPASSVPAGRASRSGGCAPASGRAPCRPRSGCARGRRRCRTAS